MTIYISHIHICVSMHTSCHIVFRTKLCIPRVNVAIKRFPSRAFKVDFHLPICHSTQATTADPEPHGVYLHGYMYTQTCFNGECYSDTPSMVGWVHRSLALDIKEQGIWRGTENYPRSFDTHRGQHPHSSTLFKRHAFSIQLNNRQLILKLKITCRLFEAGCWFPVRISRNNS